MIDLIYRRIVLYDNILFDSIHHSGSQRLEGEYIALYFHNSDKNIIDDVRIKCLNNNAVTYFDNINDSRIKVLYDTLKNSGIVPFN